MRDATKHTDPITTSDASEAASPRASGSVYRITVKGEVDDRWSSWFDGLRITHDANGDTTLAGTVRDQAALHGLLAKVRDLGLTLLAVEPSDGEPASETSSRRSPVAAIAASIVAGLGLASILVFGPASNGSEAVVTGSILLAFGLGWGLMAWATGRFSGQPQRWALVPAAVLGLTGIGLILVRPDGRAMDVLSWIWPPAIALLAIWILAQVRTRLRGRGRWLVVPLAVVLLASAIGGAIAAVSGVAGATTAPQAGQLVDVGGRRLYIECHGTGSPVVVLQVGLGGAAADWSGIAPSVAQSTTVCAYDRAGHGWSDPAPGPQDGTAIATDLHTLLERAGIAGPYILAAHSSGGPYSRVFAARYPDDVAGMALLDAQPADAFTALPDYPVFYTVYRAVMTLAPSLARTGLGTVFSTPADPAGVRGATFMHDEVLALPEALRQAQALTSIGDRPLVVVSAGTGQQDGWLAAQDRLGALSSNAVHRVVAEATHESLISGADAATSAQAILDVVASVRSGEPVR